VPEVRRHLLEQQGSADSFEDSALGASGEMGGLDHTHSSFGSNVSALSGQLEEALHLAQDHTPSPQPLPPGQHFDPKVGARSALY
jgi:hypothetical protein